MGSRIGSIAAVVALTAASLSGPPAAHAAGVTVVDGHDDLEASGLFEFQDRCSASGATPAPLAYGRLGGSRGTHSLGWQYSTVDYEVGPLAPVLAPTQLSDFRWDLLSPGRRSTGHVVAIYYDATPGYTDGYWIGFRSLAHDRSGWGTYNAAGLTLVWSYYEPGYSEVNVHTATVRQFALQRGGDGGGAWVGAAMGCEGEQFFLDNLRVAGDTYDLEGIPTVAHLEYSTDGKTVVNRRTLTLRYGQKVWMLGHSHSNEVGVFKGTGDFMAKAFGSKRFRKVDTQTFHPKYYAAKRVEPRRKTVYRFDSNGSPLFDTSTSEQVTVLVQAKVRGTVLDKEVFEGQRVAVEGRIWPGNRGVRVALQRRVDGRWVKVGSARTGRGGKFTVGTTARAPGVWKVRVEVSAGKGNLGNATKTRKVTVKKYVAPTPPPVDRTPEQETVVTPAPPAPPPAPPDPQYRTAHSPARAGASSVPACDLGGPYVVPCPPGG